MASMFEQLPRDPFSHIATFLCANDLIRLRLVSRAVGELATEYLENPASDQPFSFHLTRSFLCHVSKSFEACSTPEEDEALRSLWRPLLSKVTHLSIQCSQSSLMEELVPVKKPRLDASPLSNTDQKQDDLLAALSAKNQHNVDTFLRQIYWDRDLAKHMTDFFPRREEWYVEDTLDLWSFLYTCFSKDKLISLEYYGMWKLAEEEQSSGLVHNHGSLVERLVTEESQALFPGFISRLRNLQEARFCCFPTDDEHQIKVFLFKNCHSLRVLDIGVTTSACQQNFDVLLGHDGYDLKYVVDVDEDEYQDDDGYRLDDGLQDVVASQADQPFEVDDESEEIILFDNPALLLKIQRTLEKVELQESAGIVEDRVEKEAKMWGNMDLVFPELQSLSMHNVTEDQGMSHLFVGIGKRCPKLTSLVFGCFFKNQVDPLERVIPGSSCGSVPINPRDITNFLLLPHIRSNLHTLGLGYSGVWCGYWATFLRAVRQMSKLENFWTDDCDLFKPALFHYWITQKLSFQSVVLDMYPFLCEEDPHLALDTLVRMLDAHPNLQLVLNSFESVNQAASAILKSENQEHKQLVHKYKTLMLN